MTTKNFINDLILLSNLVFFIFRLKIEKEKKHTKILYYYITQ